MDKPNIIEVTNPNKNWDKSYKDMKAVLRGEFPPYVVRFENCCISLMGNKIPHNNLDTLKRYALKHNVNFEKLMTIYRYLPEDE